MATKLKNMKLTSVDLVRAGANQEADIGLFKSAGPQAEFDEALVRSARSILEDPDLTEDQQAGMLAKSVDDYRAALEEPEEEEPEGEEVMVEKEPEEEEPADLDEIEEVEKDYDTIEEVQKFNPFHDALGRFASSNSFRTYSANPKSKAGAMAIDRSAQAGHTYTLNVHAESKGENIGQNYDWLHHTTQAPQAPFSAMIGNTGQPKKNPKPKPKKPKTEQEQPKMEPAAKPESKANESIAEAVKDVSLSSSQKLALQARDENKHACDTKKLAEDFDGVRVEGKDISGSFDARNDPAGGSAIDAVARAQGWDKAAPTVISDRDAFDKLCMQNGRVMVRTVHEGFYDLDGKQMPGTDVFHAEDVAAGTMTRSDISLGGSGATACGGGLYMVDTGIDPGKSTKSMSARIANGQEHSWGYADNWAYKEGVQMMATLRPGAKIATYSEARALRQEFHNLPRAERERFKDKDGAPDYGAYIASKGYDGAEWDDAGDDCRYTTIYNKSALVFFSDAALRSDMTP